MKICFDGIGASSLHGTGLFAYTYEMINNLLEIYPQPEYSIIWNDAPFIPNWQKKSRISYINLEINRNKNDYSKLESYLEENKIAIYHSPNNGFSIPQNKVCNYISTIHDLYPIFDTKYVDPGYHEKFMYMLPDAIKNSDMIIAVSNFIKEELISNFTVPKEKIKVIHPGCPELFHQRSYESVREVLKLKYNITEDYILYAGSLHPRKNLDIVLRIFKRIHEKKPDLKFIIAGMRSGKRLLYYSKLKELVTELNLQGSVIFMGTVYYLDMPYFYSGAKCVVNLSDYEGFPLSSVEALCCRTPVICSRSSSFEEVLSQDGILLAPERENLIEDVLMEIVCNKNFRDSLLRKIDDRKYRIQASTKEIIRVYENTIAK